MPGLLDKVILNEKESRGRTIRLMAALDALGLAYEGAIEIGHDIETYDDLFAPEWLHELADQEQSCSTVHDVQEQAIAKVTEVCRLQCEANNKRRKMLDGRITSGKANPRKP